MTAQEWLVWFGLVVIITPLVSMATIWAIQQWTGIRTMRKVNKHLNKLSESLAKRAKQDKEVKQ